jgi:hypothetical protein
MTEVAQKNWYIVHTYSGFENKVKESLQQRVQAYGLQGEIGEILIPTEDIVEKRGGREVKSARRFFPGLHPRRDDDVGPRVARGEEHAKGHRLRRRRDQADSAQQRRKWITSSSR